MSELALVVTASGRYQVFLADLVASAEAHLVGLDHVYVLSETRPSLSARTPVTWLPWGHGPWPFATLTRPRALTAYADVLSTNRRLLQCDADMRFVGPVDLTAIDGVLAVEHPGYVGTPVHALPFETRPTSRATLPAGSGSRYVAGGVQGGTTREYLRACAVMAEWIQADLDNGITPIWHDESIWNRYCAEFPPAAVLDSSYCRPDTDPGPAARILALTKDHAAMRDQPRRKWLPAWRAVRRLRARLWRR
jgi:hypothetical protein